NNVEDLTSGRFVRYPASDLNADGWKDIISQSHYEHGNLALFENKGTSPNISLSTRAITLSDFTQTSVQPGDINGDGKVDLLVASDNRDFIILKNKRSTDEHLSNSSFEKFGLYGLTV